MRRCRRSPVLIRGGSDLVSTRRRNGPERVITSSRYGDEADAAAALFCFISALHVAVITTHRFQTTGNQRQAHAIFNHPLWQSRPTPTGKRRQLLARLEKKKPQKKPTIRNRAAKIKVVSIHRFGNGEQSRARKGKKTPGRAKSTAGISLKIKLGFKRATLESQRAHSFTRYRHEAGVGTEEYTKRRRLNPPCSLGKDGACGLAGGTADRCRRRRNVKPTGPAQPVGYRRRQRRRSTNPVDTSRFFFPSGWEAETDSSSAR